MFPLFSALILFLYSVSYSAEPQKNITSPHVIIRAQQNIYGSPYHSTQEITLLRKQSESTSSSTANEQSENISTDINPLERPSGYIKFGLRDRQEIRLGQLLGLMRLKRDPSIPENIRSKESQFFKTRMNQQGYPFYKLSQDMSTDFLNWMSSKIESFLESSPSKNNVLIFVMGSLATGNVTFFSDLEFGVMTANFNPETLKQAEELVRFLKREIEAEDMLGQGLDFDNAGLAPNVGDESDSVSDFRFLIAEPELMALYPHASVWFKKGFLTHAPKKIKDYVKEKKKSIRNPKDTIFAEHYQINASGTYDEMRALNKDRIVHTAKAMKSIRQVFGNIDLLRRFVNARNKQFLEMLEIPYEQTGYRTIKLSLLNVFRSDVRYNFKNFLINRSIVREYEQSSSFKAPLDETSNNNFPKFTLCFNELPSVNIKRHLYRPVEQTLLNMALERNLLQYDAQGINMTNLFDIVDSLLDLYPFQKNTIKSYIDFLCYLRLKEQLFMRADNEDVLINPELMQARLNLLSTQIKTAEENIESQITENDRNLWNKELERLKEQKSKCEKAMGILEISKEKYPSTLHKLFEEGQSKRVVEIFSYEDITRIKTETPVVFDLLFGLYFQDEWVSSMTYHASSSSSSYASN